MLSLCSTGTFPDTGGEEVNTWLSTALSPGPLLEAHSYSITKEVASESKPDLFSSPEHYTFVFIFTGRKTKSKQGEAMG